MSRIILFVMAGLFLTLPNPCMCQEYELLLPEGLKPGQSLSIRPFALNELAPYRYNQEPLQELQKVMAFALQKALHKSGRFSKVVVISENEVAGTSLVLEGTFSQINQGNRFGRVFGGAPATIRISGLFKQVEGSRTVLWVHCNDSRLGGLLGEETSQGIAFRIPNKSGKSLIHKSTDKIAKDIVAIIKKTDRKPASGKPFTKDKW
jgi:hypothetical protein